MGFFGNLWKWIKRILFTACMITCLLCAVGVLFVEENITKTALTVILTILFALLSIGSCISHFIFVDEGRFITTIALVVQMIIGFVLVLYCEISVISPAIFSSLFALIINDGNNIYKFFNPKKE